MLRRGRRVRLRALRKGRCRTAGEQSDDCEQGDCESAVQRQPHPVYDSIGSPGSQAGERAPSSRRRRPTFQVAAAARPKTSVGKTVRKR